MCLEAVSAGLSRSFYWAVVGAEVQMFPWQSSWPDGVSLGLCSSQGGRGAGGLPSHICASQENTVHPCFLLCLPLFLASLPPTRVA